jgi:hypothetical protein
VRTAAISKRKIVEMAYATDELLARMVGLTAAIADAPQIAVPTPISV